MGGKARRAEIEEHFLGQHGYATDALPARPTRTSGVTNATMLLSHNQWHDTDADKQSHTHTAYSPTSIKPSESRGFSAGSMTNQEVGTDRRSGSHPANAERDKEQGRR